MLITFPALAGKVMSASPQAVIAQEASCFFHEQKVAQQSCGHCGRFICSLCDVELRPGEHICPKCVALSKQGGTSHGAALETERICVGSAALGLALWPMLIFYFTLLTAPITLLFLFLQRKKPEGLMVRNKWRRWLAGSIAIVQIVAWVGLGIFFVSVLLPKIKSTTSNRLSHSSTTFTEDDWNEEESFENDSRADESLENDSSADESLENDSSEEDDFGQ
jgi:hypothetical protein